MATVSRTRIKNSPKVLLVHPGTQHAPRLAEALEREGLLHRFWTGWARTGAQAKKRAVNIPSEKLRTRPWVEWMALCLQKSWLSGEQVWGMRNRFFQKMIPEREIYQVDVVIGFDTAADVLAGRCHMANRPLVLDQTTPRRLFKKKIFQELGVPLTGHDASPKRVLEGERREQEGAANIVVASSFCRRSFQDEEKLFKKTIVVPYGVDPAFLLVGNTRKYVLSQTPLRFLYVGNLGRHKGIDILIQAWSQTQLLGGTLRVVGSGSEGIENKLRKLWVEQAGQKPIEGVAKEMAESDVLVFPSYFEGFGRVILEAMAAGLAVITTTNTGGPDVIKDGEQGFLVPPGSAQALRKKMEWMIQNREKVMEMGQRAHAQAKELTWESYGRQYKRALV